MRVLKQEHGGGRVPEDPIWALITLDGAGGVFTHVVDLITALHRERVEVCVAVLGPPLTSTQRRLLAAAAPAACVQIGFRLEWMPNPWKDLRRAAAALTMLERALRPDVIHTNSFFCGHIAWQAPVVVAVHSSGYSWWRAVHGTGVPAQWGRYRNLVTTGLHGADAVVAPSFALRDALIAEYGAAAGPVHVIHEGSSAPRVSTQRREPFALAAGRMSDEASDLAVLSEAARRMRHPVLVAGSLPRGQSVTAGDCSRAGSAHLLGQLRAGNLADLHRRASVFMAPALSEPCGQSILAAARAGCALVLGDIPSLRELWDGAAEFVGPSDAGALAETVDGLLDDPRLAMSLGAQAQRCADRYRTTTMARSYARVYRSLASERVASAAMGVAQISSR